MKKVMATGVFDILHLGHIHYLEESKKQGDYLIVVVASDKTAEKNGKRPIFSETTRTRMVNSLKVVDEAITGGFGNIYDTVEKLKPDIITLGFDQRFVEEQIIKECSKRGLTVEVYRCSPLITDEPLATRKIRERIIGEI
ncbi:adenylyltransferase/cytidyltransferase family protein [Cuniculiplasma sp. SKW3]|uniref:adenylyltransferase/cytidyltransferase family protein n=1 Tax=Cuniculiplasma sp. SKW3 TaxID=3400170 RepID=UPI003FD17BF6